MLEEVDDREFNLTMSPCECSDGMPGNRYEHAATRIYGDITYRGSAEASKAK